MILIRKTIETSEFLLKYWWFTVLVFLMLLWISFFTTILRWFFTTQSPLLTTIGHYEPLFTTSHINIYSPYLPASLVPKEPIVLSQDFGICSRWLKGGSCTLVPVSPTAWLCSAMSQFAFHQQGASASPEVLTFFFCAKLFHIFTSYQISYAAFGRQAWSNVGV